MKTKFTYFLSILLLFLLAFDANAKDDATKSRAKSEISKLLGANNIGKEFWITIPPCYEEVAGDNFIKIFVTSPVKTLVKVEVPGKGYYEQKPTIAHNVIEFNIKPTDGQPFTKGETEQPPAEKVYRSRGIHIWAEDPIVVYVVVRYRHTSDGFLAIPMASLGKEYIVAAYDEDPMFRAVWNDKFPSTTGIVAAYDQTQVRFRMGGNVFSETAGGLRPGEVATETLNKGDVWMFMSNGDNHDLTGSKITATKPVAVVSGNMCTNIPVGNQWCDYTVEMGLPTHVWGKDYHVPKVPNRKYPSIVRIFAKQPQTKIYRNGNQMGFIPEAGGVIGRGFLEMRMGPMGPPPVSAVYSGDKPIGVVLYNTGVQEDGTPHPNSDPFVMVITPTEQYQNEITFCTPSTFGGDRFSENYVNLVYETDEHGLMPPDLQIAQVQGGEFQWEPIRSKFPGLDEIFTYDIKGTQFAVKTITLPSDGVYKIRGKKPFAAYSFGYDSYDSYGYPTSAALADLSIPDTIDPVPTYVLDCDGSVRGGVVTDYPEVDSIRSNLYQIYIDPEISENYKFTYQPFIPGDTRTTNWDLTVKDINKDAYAELIFIDRAGNDTTIAIEYYATKVAIYPEDHDYGQLQIGETGTKNFFVKNESTTGEILLTELKLKDGDKGFSLVHDHVFPLMLEPNGELPFKVEFEATKEGYFRDSVGVGDTCMFINKAFVEASVGSASMIVADHDFGDISVGETIPKKLMIQSTGDADLIITGYRGPTNSVFNPIFPKNFTPDDPWVIEPGGYREFTVQFTPDAEIRYADTIFFESNADGTDEIAEIYGRGIQAQLAATSENWGRRRIDRPEFPAGPYPSDNAIRLRNDGSEAITISNFAVEEENNGDAFIFDRDMIKNLTIEDSSEVFIPVEFQPTVTGEHKLVISYTNNEGIDARTTLMGIGTVPYLTTTDYDFGRTIVGDNSTQPERTISFRTPPLSEWQYGDTLTMTDLVVGPDGNEIATNGTNFGAEGFTFDKSAIGLPVKLAPGDSITFPARFLSQHSGDHIANLTAVSDALQQDVTSNWEGFGVSEGLDFSGDQSEICIEDTDILNCVLENTKEGEIEVYSVEIDPPYPDLAFVDPSIANGFTLASYETKNIDIEFAPLGVVDRDAEVVIKNSTLKNPEIRIPISSKSVHYDRATIGKVTKNQVVIGETIDYTIDLDGTSDITMAEVKELDIRVTYENNFLKLDESSIQVGSHLNGQFELVDIQETTIDADAFLQELTFTLRAIDDNILTGSGRIATMKFTAYLPSTSIDNQDAMITDSTTAINQIVTATGNACVDFEPANTSVSMRPVCVYDLRLIAVSAAKFGLSEVRPNPVGSNGGEIEFSVGLPTYTEIAIYNSEGVRVALPIAGQLEPGKYSFPIPVSDLSSGVYYYKMKSGPYVETRPLVIAK
ncbi:MAG: choice-of-anchor D domain-containing protein [Candidatus Kapaibacterium sp.]